MDAVYGDTMQYTLRPDLFSDFSVIKVNALPGRSYFIPYPLSARPETIPATQRRYRSPLVRCLNGKWDFRYFADPNALGQTIDTDRMMFGSIDVPSVWQYRGYGTPMYLNVRYPFPYKPPVIPTDRPVGRYFSILDGFKRAPDNEMNSTGVYRTFFDLEETADKRIVISFLGVCSCVELHVNGQFAGYSEESHNTAEFDLTDLVQPGRNEMVCVVRRWCNGSYLECQDMFRNNGIFRDVLLRITDKDDIWDIDFKTKKENGRYTATITATVADGVPVRFSINGHGLNQSTEVISSGGRAEAVFEDLCVREWNAEQPELYLLGICSPRSQTVLKVGFKDVRIDGTRFTLNGFPLKFKGVNHHDTDPDNGWYMSPEQIQRDLRLCKEYNIDTIRTSHYPPDPLLIELAAEMGIYIIDEADIETHGVLYGKLPPSFNRLSDNPGWKEHYLSRICNMYQRDKALATPVVMWSLGNESGAGCNTDAAYNWLKGVSDLPVHYEGAVHSKRKAYDVASRMYPKPSELHAVSNNTCKTPQFQDRPYFMCEYAHAMGTGPGNIEAYWNEIYNSENLIGGCVWEMNDHAFREKDGQFTYGGDHGEWIHDGNFCCDGLFYPDRRPSTGAQIVRHAYRPIRIRRLEADRFTVFNTTAFTPGKDFLLKIKVSNGRSFDFVPQAGPLETQFVRWDIGPVEGDCFLTAEILGKDGRSLGTEQICLHGQIPSAPQTTGVFPPWAVCCAGFNGRFGISTGRGTVLSPEDPFTILYRAETDNDSINFTLRPMRRWYKNEEKIIAGQNEGEGRTVITEIRTAGRLFTCRDTYQACILPDGTKGILITSVLHPHSKRGFIPRFGKVFRLSEDCFSEVEYFGRSGESYPDMKEQFPIGLCRVKPAEMVEPNIRPQESGLRMDCRWAAFGPVRFTAVDAPFGLSVKTCPDSELIGTRHRDDVKKSGVYVTINAFQQGIGTGSCGPYVDRQYMYPADRDYTLRFVISLDREQ
ncbi:MAG: hypothetical protein J5785_04595 [Spirochaetales bacterium]|nr:hypothetical protein [Spirochaetales bacterium]